ncbi:MAG: hemerythrin domain-containing protein [Proteobacteria bacterium]|nr:MAG: hemerythrin domain-containing protein [Pseudomonadota bacterium]
MDIIEEINADHREIREKVALLVSNEVAPEVKAEAFSDLSTLIGAHTEAEEKTIYAYAKEIGALRHYAFQNLDDHECMTALVEKIKDAPGSAIQHARSIALSKLLKNHLDSEEEHFLPALRRELTIFDSDQLARNYRRAAQGLKLVPKDRSARILPMPARNSSLQGAPATH